MELESLELMNKEMNDALNDLEKEVRSYKSPSLHSIRSEDIICLSKIRQLAEEELSLKNCIKELEQRETIFKEQMDRLLTSREYQNVCGRRKINCSQDLECNGMKICCVPKKCLKKKQAQQKSDAVVSTSEQNVNEKPEQEIKQEKSEEQVEKKSSWIPKWWTNNENKAEEVPSQTKSVTSSNPENNVNELVSLLKAVYINNIFIYRKTKSLLVQHRLTLRKKKKKRLTISRLNNQNQNFRPRLANLADIRRVLQGLPQNCHIVLVHALVPERFRV